MECKSVSFVCFQSILLSNVIDNTLIHCKSDHGCKESQIKISQSKNVSILCEGKGSCADSIITIDNVETFILECVTFESCQELIINITNTMYPSILCYGINSCDYIKIYSDINDINVSIYSKSISVSIFVPNIYKSESISCNPNNGYLLFNSNNNINNSLIETLSNQLFGGALSCQYVTYFFTDSNNTVNVPCEIRAMFTDYTLINSLNYIQEYMSCFIPIYINEIVNIDCVGTASPSLSPTNTPSLFPSNTPVYAPSYSPLNINETRSPTPHPTNSPSITPSLNPSIAPSSSPSLNPSIAPYLSPSTSPTQPPSIIPSNIPSQPPSIAPTLIPSLYPSAIPSITPTITPTQPPSIVPTFAPSLAPSLIPTQPPSITPTITPTQPPSISPSDTPTQPPSITPTLVPSIIPSIAPSIAPSLVPTINPTQPPSIAPSSTPTNPPSVTPTKAPSNYPSLTPSNMPTLAPSNIPSSPPTLNPSFSPSIYPSNIPTLAPLNAPTLSPSSAPSRFPTENDIYDSWIKIRYDIDNLNGFYIEELEDNTLEILPLIIEIIERNYFVEETVEYKDFTINVTSINGFTDLSNINLKENAAVELNCILFSINNVAGILLEKSKDIDENGVSKFESDVTDDLRLYFGNSSDLEFTIFDSNNLKIETETEKHFQEANITILILTIIIITFGVIGTIITKILNKVPNFKVDNAKYLAPLLFSLQIYDFISDLNLTYDIFTNQTYISYSISNLIFLCGIASIIFTILPFLSNLMYGIKIRNQSVIQKNERASTYFTDKIAIFLALIIMSGGCYPALVLVSSRIFGLDSFNCGLTKHELNKLTKIKMQTTIWMENAPQLIIQIIYAAITSSTGISPAIFLAFVGSFLSVIMAISSYYANRLNQKNSDIIFYYLEFTEDDIDNKKGIKSKQQTAIIQKKGRKEHLQKVIAKEFQISHENIEFGYAKPVKYGVEYYVSHYLLKTDLDKYNTDYNKKYNKKYQYGYVIDVSPKKYLTQLYKTHKNGINNIFRDHFTCNELNNNINFDKFTVKYIIDHNTINKVIPAFTDHQNTNDDDDHDEEQEGIYYDTVKQKLPSSNIELQTFMQNVIKNFEDYIITSMKNSNQDNNMDDEKYNPDKLIIENIDETIDDINDNDSDIIMDNEDNVNEIELMNVLNGMLDFNQSQEFGIEMDDNNN